MIELAVAVILSLYLAWGIGVNALGATAGINTGSGIIDPKKAVMIAGLFSVIGIFFLSGNIVETVGSELTTLELNGAFAVILTVCILMTVFSWRGIPTSTAYLVVGAIAGYSLSSRSAINAAILGKLIFALLIAPLVAIVVGFLIYKSIKKNKAEVRGIEKRETLETSFFIPSIIAFVLISLVVGANSVGVVLGVLKESLSYSMLAVIGAIGFVAGALTWSYRVAGKVGASLTSLSPSSGFTAQLVTALTSLAFVAFGTPVSITQILVGSVIGVGLAKGHVEKKTLVEITAAWRICLPLAFAIAYVLGFVLR